MAAQLFAVVTALPDAARGQSLRQDVASVEDVAWAYLDGLLHADTAMLAGAFVEDARLLGVPGRALQVIPVEEWIASRAGEVLEPSSAYHHRIVSVDVEGDAAAVKVELVWPTTRFVDYLTLLRIDGRWKIVNKIWHQEPSPGAMARLDTRPLGEEAPARYLGRYATDRSEFEVVRRGADLFLILGGGEYRLFFQGDDVFVPEFDLEARLHFLVEDGVTRSIAVRQDGGEVRARRVESQ